MAAPCEEDECGTNCDKILHIEASEAVREIKFAVKSVEISEKLPRSEEFVFLNLTTKENEKFCVELSVQGFKIVSGCHDCIESDKESRYYETIYSLLDAVSPQYRNTFGDALMQKLAALQQPSHDDCAEFDVDASS